MSFMSTRKISFSFQMFIKHETEPDFFHILHQDLVVYR